MDEREHRLTAQERRVAVLVGGGRSNKAAARELGVSIRTVEFHLGNVYRKLGVEGRTSLANLVGRREHEPTRGNRAAAGNLPEPPTRLVGRDAPLAALLATIERHRLVTVVGPGGVGKTRITLEAARVVERESGEGSWLVDLSTVDRPADLVALMIESLRLRPRTADQRGLVDALHHQHRLVLLDNCEHLIDGVADLAESIIARCPGVRALAASRERLDVLGERVVALGPLSVEPVDGATLSPAARLYCDRAADVDPTFDPDHQPDAIERLCAALDGLPLAIELAAAQLPAFSAADLERRLDDRLALLARPRQRGRRHDSLWATIDWSYAQLTGPQQEVLRRLAVFVGDFDQAAAEAIAGIAPIEPLLDALVAKSLVVARPGDTGMRYRLLDTIATFARTLLDEHGERLGAADRHLTHYATLSAHADACLRGTEEHAGRAVFDADWHNFRAAMAHACAAHRPAAALELLSSVMFWTITRMRSEVAAWAGEMMEMPELARAPLCLLTTAYFANAAGHVDEGLALVREVQQAGIELDQPWLSYIAPFCVPFDEVIEWTLVTQAHSAGFWEVTGRLQEAIARSYYVSIALPAEDERRVHLRRIEEAAAMAERHGNLQGIGYGLMALGNALSVSEPPRAIALLERVVEIASSLGAELLLANTRQELAHALWANGEFAAALRVVVTSLRAEMRAGWLVDLHYVLICSLVPLAELGQRDVSAQVFSWLEDNSPLGPGLRATFPSLADELAPLPDMRDIDVTTIATLVAETIDRLPTYE